MEIIFSQFMRTTLHIIFNPFMFRKKRLIINSDYNFLFLFLRIFISFLFFWGEISYVHLGVIVFSFGLSQPSIVRYLGSYWLVAIIPFYKVNKGWSIRFASRYLWTGRIIVHLPPSLSLSLSVDKWTWHISRLAAFGPQWAVAPG